MTQSNCQPIAVFTSKGPTNGTTLAKLILQAIVVLENAGVYVQGVVSDGASTNKKFWSIFGCSGKIDELKTSFPHPSVADREVFIFSDTPHLIKNVRNRLFNKKQLKVSLLIILYAMIKLKINNIFLF